MGQAIRTALEHTKQTGAEITRCLSKFVCMYIGPSHRPCLSNHQLPLSDHQPFHPIINLSMQSSALPYNHLSSLPIIHPTVKPFIQLMCLPCWLSFHNDYPHLWHPSRLSPRTNTSSPLHYWLLNHNSQAYIVIFTLTIHRSMASVVLIPPMSSICCLSQRVASVT